MDHLENHSVDVFLFIEMLESLVNLIGNPSMCRGVLKSINVLKNKDYCGMRFIKRNIYWDFRMIYDRGLYRNSVKEICDDIEKVINKYFSDVYPIEGRTL